MNHTYHKKNHLNLQRTREKLKNKDIEIFNGFELHLFNFVPKNKH